MRVVRLPHLSPLIARIGQPDTLGKIVGSKRNLAYLLLGETSDAGIRISWKGLGPLRDGNRCPPEKSRQSEHVNKNREIEFRQPTELNFSASFEVSNHRETYVAQKYLQL